MYTEDVIAHFGTKSKIVNALKTSKTPRSKGAVSMWGELVPLIVAHELSAISRGKLKVNLALYQKESSKNSHVLA